MLLLCCCQRQEDIVTFFEYDHLLLNILCLHILFDYSVLLTQLRL